MYKASNPFSTRFTHPGALPYVFLDGRTASGLVDDLRQFGWWGQIVGPHGSGKTTLVETLRPHIETARRNVVVFSQHDRQRRLTANRRAMRAWKPTTQVVVDGYEQLSRLSRFFLRAHCRRCQCGLLITTHTGVGLPTLYTTRVSRKLVTTLVNRLDADQLIAGWQIDLLYGKHAGNVREMFFELYDVVGGQFGDGLRPCVHGSDRSR